MFKFISLPLCLLVGLMATAQTRPLSGTLIEESTGNAIAGATVKVKGKPIATTSNGSGQFTLNVPTGSLVLEISSVGYNSKEVPVTDGTANISISLIQNTEELGEVVVTALGITKEARKIGYAVTTVNGDLLNQAKEPNVANSLEGRVSGLDVSG